MIRKAFQEQYSPILEEFGLAHIPRKLLCLLEYDKKEYIYQEGRPVSHLLIILSGRAKVVTFTEEGKTLMHSFSEQGGILGEVEMIRGIRDAYLYVQAVTPVQCIGISLPEGTKLLRENLSFMNRLCQILVKKLHYTNYNSSRIILYSLENRLCSYIEMTSTDGYFEEQLTQVAELLGTSYRHLLRTIEKLCKEDILQKTRHGYFIANPQVLQQRGRGFYSTTL